MTTLKIRQVPKTAQLVDSTQTQHPALMERIRERVSKVRNNCLVIARA